MAIGEVLPSTTVKMPTPDGTLFLDVICDNEGQPIMLTGRIGKAGSRTNAWASALSLICTLALEKGADITEVLEALSNVASETSIYHRPGVHIRSGPEGFAHALIVFQRERPEEPLI